MKWLEKNSTLKLLGYWLLAVFICLSACQPTGKERIIKVGLTHGKQHSFSQALQRFADQVEQQSQGRYQIRIFHSAQLGGEKEMQEMLAIGSLDISLSGVINTYEPLFAVFELPYLYRDRAHVLQVNQSPVMDEMSRSLHDQGIRLVGFYENGFRHISNSRQPIMKPADLEGLLIRTPENPAQIETIRALGAIPTPMSFSELYTALMQKVVDGQENPLQNIWHGRVYEAQAYIAKTAHIYNSVYILAAQKFWKSLPPADQNMFAQAILASSKWQLAYMEELDKSLEQKMKDLGIEFSYPDRTVFEQASLPAYDALYEQLGPKAREIVRAIKNIDQ